MTTTTTVPADVRRVDLELVQHLADQASELLMTAYKAVVTVEQLVKLDGLQRRVDERTHADEPKLQHALHVFVNEMRCVEAPPILAAQSAAKELELALDSACAELSGGDES